MSIAVNLRTGERRSYSCSAFDAVVAAYAQSLRGMHPRGDWYTWQYPERYGHLVEVGRWHWFVADWGVRRDDIAWPHRQLRLEVTS